MLSKNEDNVDYLVFVVPTSGLKGMGAADQHSRLLSLGNHPDVVLALRLISVIIIIKTMIIVIKSWS